MHISAIRVSATRKIKTLSRDVRFALDEDVCRQDASDGLLLTGWVIHRKKRIKRVTLSSRGKSLAQGELIVQRPRVRGLYPGYPDAKRAGFSFLASALPVGKYDLTAELENGKVVVLAELVLVHHTQPKLLFMHIPKSAGSTVNRFFTSHYPDSHHAIHIESNPDWQSDPDWIHTLDFISGHVPLPVLARKLNLDEYFKVTVVREPFAQLVSHLAWVRHLAEPVEEQRLGRHPLYIQEFARKLRMTDLSEPVAIRALIARFEELECRLVENCLVRYFCAVPPGRPVSNDDLDRAKAACDEFDRIGMTGKIDDFLADIAMAMGWKKPQRKIVANVSQGYYGIDLQDTELRAALEPLVRYDLQLFEHIRSASK